MKMNYVTKIQSNLKNYKRIHTQKATSRIMDGSYNSVYKGRSMNFDEIRDYVTGDDIKDVDWKASARGRKLLVRQYIAEKKHNIMLVIDTNCRMLADTDSSIEKKEVALLSAGTLAYLVSLNGDYISSAYAVDSIKDGRKDFSISCTPFRTGLANIENILQGCNKAFSKQNHSNLDTVLNFIARNFRRRMIVVLVTDIQGINEISETTLKRILLLNDMLVINVGSACLDGNNAFNVLSDTYLPAFLAKDKRLMKMQRDKKQELENSNIAKLKKFGISMATIDNTENIDDNIIKLIQKKR